VQPQPLGEPLLRIHQGHLHILAPLDPSRELDRCGHTRVTRPQNQDAVRSRHADFALCVHRSAFLLVLTTTRRKLPTWP
jgi:hypothetical protein